MYKLSLRTFINPQRNNMGTLTFADILMLFLNKEVDSYLILGYSKKDLPFWSSEIVHLFRFEEYIYPP